jgi:hypothetical protein
MVGYHSSASVGEREVGKHTVVKASAAERSLVGKKKSRAR